jgi:putative SbcD/Mre11-related phosphoesterase
MEAIFEDRALVVKADDLRALIIADLHLGFEHTLYETKGIAYPAQDASMLKRIASLVETHTIEDIHIVGDVKHSITADSRPNWQSVPDFMSALADLCRTHVIPGNHDGDLLALLPRSVTLLDVRGTVVGEGEETIGLLHGHSWPSPKVLGAQMLVIGHNHPTLRNVRTVDAPEIDRADRRRFAGVIPIILRSKLDKTCVRQIIGAPENPDDIEGVVVTLPSFNELFSGVQVNTPKTTFYGPFFENGCADILKSDAYSIAGVYLGTVESLRERFNEMIK